MPGKQGVQVEWLPPLFASEIKLKEPQNFAALVSKLEESVQQISLAENKGNYKMLDETLDFVNLLSMHMKSKYRHDSAVVGRAVVAGVDLFFAARQCFKIQEQWGLVVTGMIQSYRKELKIELQWRPFYELLMDTLEAKRLRPSHRDGLTEQWNIGFFVLITTCRKFFPKSADSQIWAEFGSDMLTLDRLQRGMFDSFSLAALFMPMYPDFIVQQFGGDLSELVDIAFSVQQNAYWRVGWMIVFSRLAQNDIQGVLDWSSVSARLYMLCLENFKLPVGSSTSQPPASLNIPTRASTVLGLVVICENSAELYWDFGDFMAKFFSQMYGPLDYPLAKFVVYTMDKDGLKLFCKLVDLIEQYYHPSNTDRWTSALANFLGALRICLCLRLEQEHKKQRETVLGEDTLQAFCDQLLRIVKRAQFAKDWFMEEQVGETLKELSYLCPQKTLPIIRDRLVEALDTDINSATFKVTSSMNALALTLRPMLFKGLDADREAALQFISGAMREALPGIDANDMSKTRAVLNFLTVLFHSIRDLPSVFKFQLQIDEWIDGFLSRVFNFLQNRDNGNNNGGSKSNGDISAMQVEGSRGNSSVRKQLQVLFERLGEVLQGDGENSELRMLIAKKLGDFVMKNYGFEGGASQVGYLVMLFYWVCPKEADQKIMIPVLKESLLLVKDLQGEISKSQEQQVGWYLVMLQYLTLASAEQISTHLDTLLQIIQICTNLKSEKLQEHLQTIIISILTMLTTSEIYGPAQVSFLPDTDEKILSFATKKGDNVIHPPSWKIPPENNFHIAKSVLTKILNPQIEILEKFLDSVKMPLTFESRLQIGGSLSIICGCMESINGLITLLQQDQYYEKFAPVRPSFQKLLKIIDVSYIKGVKQKCVKLFTRFLRQLDVKEQSTIEMVFMGAYQALGVKNFNSQSNGFDNFQSNKQTEEGKISGYLYGDPWVKRFAEFSLRAMAEELYFWRTSMSYPRKEDLELNQDESLLLQEMLRQCMNPYESVRSYAIIVISQIFNSHPHLLVAFLPHLLLVSSGLTTSLPSALPPYKQWPPELSNTLQSHLQKLQNQTSTGLMPQLDSEGFIKGALSVLTRINNWTKLISLHPVILKDLCYSLLIMQAHQDQQVVRSVDSLLLNITSTQWKNLPQDVVLSLVQLLVDVEKGGQGIQSAANFLLLKLMKYIVADLQVAKQVLKKMLKSLVSEHQFVAQSGVLGCLVIMRELGGEAGLKQVVDESVGFEGFMTKYLDLVATQYANQSNSEGQSRQRRRPSTSETILLKQQQILINSYQMDYITSKNGSCMEYIVNLSSYIYQSVSNSTIIQNWIQDILKKAVENVDPLNSSGNVEDKHKAWAARDILIGFLSTNDQQKSPFNKTIISILGLARDQSGLEDSRLWASSVTLSLVYQIHYLQNNQLRSQMEGNETKIEIENYLVGGIDREVVDSTVDLKPLYGIITYLNFWIFEDASLIVDFIGKVLKILADNGWIQHPVRMVREQVATIMTLFYTFFNLKNQKIEQNSNLKQIQQQFNEIFSQIQTKFEQVAEQVSKQETQLDKKDVEINGGMGIAIFSAFCSFRLLTVPEFVLKMSKSVFQMVNIKDSNELQTVREDAMLVAAKTKYILFNQTEINFVIQWLCNVDQFKNCQWQERAVRLQFLQVFWFKHDLFLSKQQIIRLQELVQVALTDEKLEIRKIACSFLTGIVKTLSKDEFSSMLDDLIKQSKKQSKKQLEDEKHGIVLGMKAILESHPYDVEDWMPRVLLSLSRVASKWGAPAGPAASATVVEFRRTKNQQQIVQLKEIMDVDEWDEVQGTGVQNTYFA